MNAGRAACTLSFNWWWILTARTTNCIFLIAVHPCNYLLANQEKYGLHIGYKILENVSNNAIFLIKYFTTFTLITSGCFFTFFKLHIFYLQGQICCKVLTILIWCGSLVLSFTSQIPQKYPSEVLQTCRWCCLKLEHSSQQNVSHRWTGFVFVDAVEGWCNVSATGSLIWRNV